MIVYDNQNVVYNDSGNQMNIITSWKKLGSREVEVRGIG